MRSILITLVCLTGTAEARQLVQGDLNPVGLIHAFSEKGRVAFSADNLRGNPLSPDPGIGFSGIMEGVLAPHYSVFFRQDPLTANYMLVFTPKVVVRMDLGEDSSPVDTPSYMPRGTLHFWWKQFTGPARPGRGSIATVGPFDYVSVVLSHHSNGQDGMFRTGGQINFQNGDFTTHFWEVAYNRITAASVNRTGRTGRSYSYKVGLEGHRALGQLPGTGGRGWCGRIKDIQLMRTSVSRHLYC